MIDTLGPKKAKTLGPSVPIFLKIVLLFSCVKTFSAVGGITSLKYFPILDFESYKQSLIIGGFEPKANPNFDKNAL